jgi:serine/threonine protein kinase
MYVQGMEVQMVLELCDLGNLRVALNLGIMLTCDGLVNYMGLLDLAGGIARGMLHLHKLNILHGDLKTMNVLLKSTGSEACGVVPKLADFGLSVKMGGNETHVSSLCQGTPTHMAPELLLSGRQSKASDV